MKVMLCGSTTTPLSNLAGTLAAAAGVEVVAVTSTGRDALDVLNSGGIDVSLHSEDTIELSRFIRSGIRPEVEASLHRVVAADTPVPHLYLRAHAFGFDGVVPSHGTPSALVGDLSDVKNGRTSLGDHPAVRSTGIPHGILTRPFRAAPAIDPGISGLIAVGLTDREIAGALGISIQSVRNQVEELIHLNGVSNRTQLAVLLAIDITIPDFS